MEQILLQILLLVISSVGVTIFWRTCIYTRGAIFRPFGRMLDYWVAKGCKENASFKWKFLRFIAFPLGRCVYCSSFHFTYEIFFLYNLLFKFNLDITWLIPTILITHLGVIIFMKYLILNNSDLVKGDWTYMKEGVLPLVDYPNRYSLKSPLTKEEEDILERCKSDF